MLKSQTFECFQPIAPAAKNIQDSRVRRPLTRSEVSKSRDEFFDLLFGSFEASIILLPNHIAANDWLSPPQNPGVSPVSPRLLCDSCCYHDVSGCLGRPRDQKAVLIWIAGVGNFNGARNSQLSHEMKRSSENPVSQAGIQFQI